MDATPDRNRISTPISKFEDSPVFNFINELSPLKPVKPLHIAQSLNSLSFASLPSVFTSPHVSSQKDSRFLRRNSFFDPFKPEFSSNNPNNINSNEASTSTVKLPARENADPEDSVGKPSVEPPNEHSEFPIELACTLKYDCGSPDSDPMPCTGFETNPVSELAGTSSPSFPRVSEKASFGIQLHEKDTCQIEHRREGAGSDWESLIDDAADLLSFDSPHGSESFKPFKKSTDPGISPCTLLISQFLQNDSSDLQNMQVVGADHTKEDPSTQPEEAGFSKETNQLQDDIAKTSLNSIAPDSEEKKGNELASNLHSGIRRRCLVFEMAGAHRKKLKYDLDSSSSTSQEGGRVASCDNQLVPIKRNNDSSRHILPGIGLHLNALATTSMDYKVVKCETVTSMGNQISISSSTTSVHLVRVGQEHVIKPLNSTVEKDICPDEHGVHTMEDASQAPDAYLVNEERKLENGGEPEGCKRCNCKKSKCLKLYCECFAAGVYCVEPCSCQDCFNKPIHEDTVLATRKQIESRNPLAFAPKVIRTSDSIPETGDDSNKTPASARHKRGCNCKKSSCLKKYCECFQGGVGCSINCRCEGCRNAFGRKDGSTPETDAEPEEETDMCERNPLALQRTLVQNDEEQNLESAVPITPLASNRPSIQLPFSSKGKPPRSAILTIGSSSGLLTTQGLGKPNFLGSQFKFEKHFQTVQEDEMPEILQSSCSPASGIKTASPNSKRVSPPHCDLGVSPTRRSGRKLILQSIPSFPSLTPQH
ncbi:CRC domain [Dillenia turbinata]|uniref:CRC domain n=1 Tax=Dillenia turbinata TaxID=194707 RepID=A0AAN8VM67_9MAGN